MNHIAAFQSAIRAAGLEPPEMVEADGKLHRFASNGKRSDDAGWYVLHGDGLPAGRFGCWRSGVSEKWRADIGRELTKEESAAVRAKYAEQQRERKAAEREQHGKAGERAAAIWAEAEAATDENAYLKRKGIRAYGLRVYRGDLVVGGMPCDGCLIVPARDTDGVIHSLEFIHPTRQENNKRFLPFGNYSGHYFGIGKPDGSLCIAEGFATGASIHETTGQAVAVAFTAGNLENVARVLRQKFPDIKLILCADNDVRADGHNPGIEAATKAAQAVGGFMVIPKHGGKKCDFNDLHQKRGAEAVKAAFEKPAKVAVPRQAQQSGGPVTVSLICGSDINPEAIRWLWEGFLAQGKLHIMAGAPGTGKTTLALAMAATMTAGGRWPDGTRCAAGNVLIWSGEDDANDTLLPRLLAMGADRSKVYFVGAARINNEPVPFDPAYHLPELLEAAAKIGGIRLLIVDPIVNAVAGDSHQNTEVRRSLQPIVDLAARLDAAALGISHFSKGTMGRDPVERITGSVAFGALPRIVFAAAKDQDGGRILVRTKSNIGPDGGGFKYDLGQIELREVPGLFASRVLWGEALEGSAKELLAVAEVDQDAGERTITVEVTEWLRALITDEGGEIDKRDVIKLARDNGFSERTIYRARDALRCKVRTLGFGKEKRSKWALPADPGNPANPANFANLANNYASQKAGRIGKNGEIGEDEGVII